jgi:hypothetical protein
MAARRSDFCLEVRLPASPGLPTQFQLADGESWQGEAGAPADGLRTKALWKALASDWPRRTDILHEAGVLLGRWLYGEETTRRLARSLSRFDRQAPGRIELRVPRSMADWPWEVATLEGIGPPAVNPALALVRVADDGSGVEIPAPAQLVVDLVGVDAHGTEELPELAAAAEIERIRMEIESAGRRGRFSVEVHTGDWKSLVRRYQEHGPPDLFHFAGHGMADGSGLFFRGDYGDPVPIPAELIAVLLARRDKGRRTRMVFLNACASTAPGHKLHQPFGGLGQMLIKHGVPAVVGLDAPVEDREATRLAEAFYGSLSEGDGADCSVQWAREALFLNNEGISWAFLNLTVTGVPEPVWRAPDYHGAIEPSANLWAFGHDEQRQRLERFVDRRDPMVIVVHGDRRSGHRHVARRVQVDLERAGKSLWRPVASMHWFVPGERELSRNQLAGGVARALDLRDDGSIETLEERLAKAIAERCSDAKVLVIDVEEVIAPVSQVETDALVTLVQDLWSSVMTRAARFRDSLPVYLLLSIAYPAEPTASDPRAKKQAETRRRVREAIDHIGTRKRLGKVRVEVLPELKPFDERYISEFLEEVLELDTERAGSIADHLVEAGDNELILDRMKQLLATWSERA